MTVCGVNQSFGQMANMEKERIKHAMEGERLVGEDDDGLIWESCSDDECNSEILAVFDECVYEALQAMHAVRALDLMASGGVPYTFENYAKALASTDTVEEYVYEGDQEDIPESELAENQ